MQRQVSPAVRKTPTHQSFVRPRTATHVTRAHALLQLQRKVGNQRVADCMKGHDVLPQGVGVVEQIHRESVLTEMLGRERAGFEGQIRQDWDARKFVCKAGVPAMMALFYNRDYHNRLDVPRAIASFEAHPHFYSVGALDRLTRKKRFLELEYGITLRSGDKEWSPADIRALWQALSTLTHREAPVLRGYRVFRWTTRCNELRAHNPDAECELKTFATCGIHFGDPTERVITMYDCATTDSAVTTATGHTFASGAETLLHEIGHAMEIGRTKLALDREKQARVAYEHLKKQVDAATGRAKASLSAQLARARQELDEASRTVRAAVSAPALREFARLVRGKPALTPYAATGITEAFAEAFMLFKMHPEQLKKANKKLYDWFDSGEYL